MRPCLLARTGARRWRATAMSDDADQSDHPPSTTGADRLRIYVAIPAALLLFNSAFYLIRNTLPNYLESKGLGGLSGLMQAVLPATSLLLAVPMGLLSDRFSPRKLALAGLVLFCLFAGLVWLMGDEAPPTAVLFAAYFLCGVSMVVANNTIRPLYLKCVGHTHQARKLAMFSAVSMLGFGTGPFVAGLAYRYLGWPLEEQFRLSLPLGLLGLAAAALMKDSTPTPFNLAAYRQSILRRPVLVYFMMLFVNALHFGIEAVCVAPFCKRQLGMDDWGVGCYFGSIALVLAVTAVGTMRLREHALNRHRMWIWGLVFSALFNMSVGLVTSPWQFFVLRYGHVIADGFMLVASLQIVAAIFPRRRVGGPMGLMSVVQTLGILAGSLVAGFIVDWNASPPARLALPFVLTGVLVLAAVVVQLLMRERL